MKQMRVTDEGSLCNKFGNDELAAFFWAFAPACLRDTASSAYLLSVNNHVWVHNVAHRLGHLLAFFPNNEAMNHQRPATHRIHNRLSPSCTESVMFLPVTHPQKRLQAERI